MMTTPENLPLLESKSPTTSPTYAKSSVKLSSHNPFQGPGVEDAWRRLLAQPSTVVTREEMMRRVQEQAGRSK